ncbi:MAG TPA: CBS domain-containing protein [Campylobacterales bacterium]|nr:CBS domain-containing protein [Campylobacterales bacterium]
MLIEEVMTSVDKLVLISPMGTVRSTLELMKKNDIRSVIVDKSSQSGAYGLITFENVLESIVAEDGDIDLLNVYDIATIPAFSVSAKLDTQYAAKMMVNSKIKRLLVVDNNELLGILTITDIIGSLMESIEEI